MRDISISQLRESVIDYNSRSIFINAHPKRSLNKIDIISLFYLTDDFKVEKIIPSLFQNESLQINLKLDLNCVEDVDIAFLISFDSLYAL